MLGRGSLNYFLFLGHFRPGKDTTFLYYLDLECSSSLSQTRLEEIMVAVMSAVLFLFYDK